jgi:hypothetical protein
MISINELEEFTNKFNPDKYSNEELLTLLGLAICLRAEIHNTLNNKKCGAP